MGDDEWLIEEVGYLSVCGSKLKGVQRSACAVLVAYRGIHLEIFSWRIWDESKRSSRSFFASNASKLTR